MLKLCFTLLQVYRKNIKWAVMKIIDLKSEREQNREVRLEITHEFLYLLLDDFTIV